MLFVLFGLYFCVAFFVGLAHQNMYPGDEYNNSRLTSYLIVGLFWPLSVLLALFVFTLRAFDVNI